MHHSMLNNIRCLSFPHHVHYILHLLFMKPLVDQRHKLLLAGDNLQMWAEKKQAGAHCRDRANAAKSTFNDKSNNNWAVA